MEIVARVSPAVQPIRSESHLLAAVAAALAGRGLVPMVQPGLVTVDVDGRSYRLSVVEDDFPRKAGPADFERHKAGVLAWIRGDRD